MHQKGGDLNRDRQVARPGGWLDWVAKTLPPNQSIHGLAAGLAVEIREYRPGGGGFGSRAAQRLSRRSAERSIPYNIGDHDNSTSDSYPWTTPYKLKFSG